MLHQAQKEGLDVRKELTAFIGELAGYARGRKPGFLLIAQNAPELGNDTGYNQLFDAIAQEDIWYDGSGDPITVERKVTFRLIRCGFRKTDSTVTWSCGRTRAYQYLMQNTPLNPGM
ncbi:MAG: hypothetical protein IPN08_02745 [Bacteroidales bacterium]|nr:hypothetical protein [Bacteroidales bacterium]